MSKELLLAAGRKLIDVLPLLETDEEKCGVKMADILNELLKAAKVQALEDAAAKLERIAARVEEKGEYATYETNRVEANRLYAMWLRTGVYRPGG